MMSATVPRRAFTVLILVVAIVTPTVVFLISIVGIVSSSCAIGVTLSRLLTVISLWRFLVVFLFSESGKRNCNFILKMVKNFKCLPSSALLVVIWFTRRPWTRSLFGAILFLCVSIRRPWTWPRISWATWRSRPSFLVVIVICTIRSFSVRFRLLRVCLFVCVRSGIDWWHGSLDKASPHVVRAVGTIYDCYCGWRVIAMFLFPLLLKRKRIFR